MVTPVTFPSLMVVSVDNGANFSPDTLTFAPRIFSICNVLDPETLPIVRFPNV